MQNSIKYNLYFNSGTIRIQSTKICKLCKFYTMFQEDQISINKFHILNVKLNILLATLNIIQIKVKFLIFAKAEINYHFSETSRVVLPRQQNCYC